MNQVIIALAFNPSLQKDGCIRFVVNLENVSNIDFHLNEDSKRYIGARIAFKGFSDMFEYHYLVLTVDGAKNLHDFYQRGINKNGNLILGSNDIDSGVTWDGKIDLFGDEGE